MAWARVAGATLAGNAGLAGGTTTWNVGTLGHVLLANDKMIAVVTTSDSTVVSALTISDSINASSSWKKDLSLTFGGFQETSVWSCVSGAGTPSNITLTTGTNASGIGAGISITAYRGLATGGGVGDIDISKLSTFSATTTADSGTTAGSTSAANQLKIGAYGDEGDVTTLSAGTVDTTYSIFAKNDLNGSDQTAIEDADSGGSGSTARAEILSSGAAGGVMAVMVYKLSAGGGPAVEISHLLLLGCT